MKREGTKDEQKEIASAGGIASGEARRDLRLEMIELMAGRDLAREEYRRAIRRYVREERKKRGR